jgi:hypothetical protein
VDTKLTEVALSSAASPSSYGGDDAHPFEPLAKGERHIPSTAVGVTNEARGRLPSPRRHLRGVDHEPGSEVAPRRPASDPSRVDAEHEGQVGEALVRFSVGNVHRPKPIRRGSGEVPTDEVQSGCGRGGRRRLKSFVVPRRFYDSAAELKQAVLSALRLLGAVELQC